MNNKRRFLNRIFYGPGVAYGLRVSILDDLTVLVDQGVALDGGGREIMVESSVVKKLSAIEGFGETAAERIQLGIRYIQEAIHPVYAMGENEAGENYECNRIREGYELFVTEYEEQGRGVPSFLREEILLKQEDYTVTLSIPETVCQGYLTRLTVKARKCSGEKKPLSFESTLQFPAFMTKEGSHELQIGMRDILLEEGEEYRKDYWVLVGQGSADTADIIGKRGSGQAFVGDFDVPLQEDFRIALRVCHGRPEEAAVSVAGAGREADADGADTADGIRLAEICLLRREGAYVISSVSDKRKYLALPAADRERQMYISCFERPFRQQEAVRQHTPGPEAEQEPPVFRMPRMTGGTLEIPLDVRMKKGDVCYSEEILHGLGVGAVYVEAGLACLEEGGGMGGSVKSTIYGDGSLFGEQDHSQVSTAVRVFHDKGSFQVAARLEGEPQSIVLLINWVAMRFDSGGGENRLTADLSEMSITARTPAVRLRPGKSCYIDVLFQRMDPCRLVYELTESGSGQLTQEGIYTAPAACGLYEIHVYCADFPRVDTYVYAIVER